MIYVVVGRYTEFTHSLLSNLKRRYRNAAIIIHLNYIYMSCAHLMLYKSVFTDLLISHVSLQHHYIMQFVLVNVWWRAKYFYFVCLYSLLPNYTAYICIVIHIHLIEAPLNIIRFIRDSMVWLNLLKKYLICIVNSCGFHYFPSLLGILKQTNFVFICLFICKFSIDILSLGNILSLYHIIILAWPWRLSKGYQHGISNSSLSVPFRKW